MRVADLFRRLYKSFAPLEIAEFNPYSALSINRILATSAFGFLVLSKPPFYPLLEMATFSPVMRPKDRELTSSLIQTANWNYVLNRANE